MRRRARRRPQGQGIARTCLEYRPAVQLIQLNMNKSGLHGLEWKTRDPYSLVNDSHTTRTHCTVFNSFFGLWLFAGGSVGESPCLPWPIALCAVYDCSRGRPRGALANVFPLNLAGPVRLQVSQDQGPPRSPARASRRSVGARAQQTPAMTASRNYTSSALRAPRTPATAAHSHNHKQLHGAPTCSQANTVAAAGAPPPQRHPPLGSRATRVALKNGKPGARARRVIAMDDGADGDGAALVDDGSGGSGVSPEAGQDAAGAGGAAMSAAAAAPGFHDQVASFRRT